MNVILKEEVPNLGTLGDLVLVKDGYARNYLLPRGLAVVANPLEKKRWMHEKRLLAKKKEQLFADFKQQAAALEKLSLVVSKPVGEATFI